MSPETAIQRESALMKLCIASTVILLVNTNTATFAEVNDVQNETYPRRREGVSGISGADADRIGKRSLAAV